MSNKEMAVQLYIAYLQAHVTVGTHPKSQGINLPSQDEMVSYIKNLAEKLSTIKDD